MCPPSCSHVLMSWKTRFESAHAVAYALKLAPTLSSDKSLIVNLSGRGDKDVQQIFEMTHKKDFTTSTFGSTMI